MSHFDEETECEPSENDKLKKKKKKKGRREAYPWCEISTLRIEVYGLFIRSTEMAEPETEVGRIGSII